MLSLFSKKMFASAIITISFTGFGFGAGGFGNGAGVASQSPSAQNAQNPAVNSGAASGTSYNWSGYEATNGTFTAVSGSWTVPNIPSATSTEADATWIGIGGVTGHDLIQVGTQAVIDNSGAPSYQAWYETLPQATQQVALTVSPGDSMTASLTETSQNEWTVSIRDNTTGQSYQTSISYDSSLSSAEWIEEMPSTENNFVPLDNFGTVSFTGGTTTENGNSVTISGADAGPLTMVNSGGSVLASPSSLGADGESFTATRSSVPSTSSGSSYIVITQGAGGRGWRRTGVGIQGFTPRSRTSTSTSAGRFGNSSFYQIIQQFRQLQQQFQEQQQQEERNSENRNSFRIGRY